MDWTHPQPGQQTYAPAQWAQLQGFVFAALVRLGR